MTTQALPDAAELLADLRRAGVNLSAKGERLAFDAPAGVVTPELRATLQARKAELLAAVRESDASFRRRLAADLAALRPYRTADGKTVWVRPDCVNVFYDLQPQTPATAGRIEQR